MNTLILPKHEIDEFFKLKEKLFGDHWDGSNYPDDLPDWKRYQVLMAKIHSYLRRRKMREKANEIQTRNRM